MNTLDEKMEPNTHVLIEVNRPEENTGSTRITGWIDRFEDWINVLKDVVKILAE
jgi:hypothetical protein